MVKIMRGNHTLFLFIIFFVCFSHLYAQKNYTLKFKKIEKCAFWVPRYSNNMDSSIQSRIGDDGRSLHSWILPENLIDSVEARNDTLYVFLVYEGMSVCADSAKAKVRMIEMTGMANSKRHFSINIPICEDIETKYDFLIMESFGRLFLFKRKKEHLFVLVGVKDIDLDMKFCKSRKITITYDCIFRW